MKRIYSRLLCGMTALALIASAPAAFAGERVFSTRLSGLNEVPALNSGGSGTFIAVLDEKAQELRYRLEFSDLEAPPIFAHIHFGQRFVNGGVIVFLCNNVPDIPVDTPACPADGGVVTGTLTAADVIGPEDQGVDPGDFETFVRLLRRDITYANVHSQRFQAGEIRGQIR